jgi:hypothetical protein
VKLKWIFAAGTVVGIALASRRRNQRAAAEGDRWAAATDPVAPQPEA